MATTVDRFALVPIESSILYSIRCKIDSYVSDGDGNTRFAVFMDKTGDLRRLYWDKTMPDWTPDTLSWVTVFGKTSKIHATRRYDDPYVMVSSTLSHATRYATCRDVRRKYLQVIRLRPIVSAGAGAGTITLVDQNGITARLHAAISETDLSFASLPSIDHTNTMNPTQLAELTDPSQLHIIRTAAANNANVIMRGFCVQRDIDGYLNIYFTRSSLVIPYTCDGSGSGSGSDPYPHIQYVPHPQLWDLTNRMVVNCVYGILTPNTELWDAYDALRTGNGYMYGNPEMYRDVLWWILSLQVGHIGLNMPAPLLAISDISDDPEWFEIAITLWKLSHKLNGCETWELLCALNAGCVSVESLTKDWFSSYFSGAVKTAMTRRNEFSKTLEEPGAKWAYEHKWSMLEMRLAYGHDEGHDTTLSRLKIQLAMGVPDNMLEWLAANSDRVSGAYENMPYLSEVEFAAIRDAMEAEWANIEIPNTLKFITHIIASRAVSLGVDHEDLHAIDDFNIRLPRGRVLRVLPSQPDSVVYLFPNGCVESYDQTIRIKKCPEVADDIAIMMDFENDPLGCIRGVGAEYGLCPFCGSDLAHGTQGVDARCTRFNGLEYFELDAHA